MKPPSPLQLREHFVQGDVGRLVFDKMAGGDLHHFLERTGWLPEEDVATVGVAYLLYYLLIA